MPRRRDFPQKEEDPFRSINNWDDGNNNYFMSSDRNDDRRQRNRHRSPSPPSRRTGGGGRHRHSSPSPVRRRRPSLDARATAPPRSREDSPPRRRDRSRDRSRDRDHGRDRDRDRRSSTSPRRHHDRDRGAAGLNKDYYANHPSHPAYAHNESDLPPPQPSRPGLSRSKTTSAKDRLASLAKVSQNLSPQWKKAATAAFQAGGMAALAARKQPGDWAGMKGAKVATAALGAMAMEGFGKGTAGGDRDRNDRDRSRDRDRDYRDRDRDRSRDRDRREYRDRDRGRDRDDRGSSGKKRGEVEVLGDVLGGFIKDQWAKRGANRARD